MIQEYKNELLSGKPCLIHEDFIPAMDLFCQYLKIAGCKFIVTSAYDPNHLSLNAKQGAIVAPATHGNHLIGNAIDGNLIDKSGKIWTSEMMKVFCVELPQYNSKIINEILVFINLVRRSSILRWGGDFHPDRKGNTDPVHWDNALNIRSPKRWQEIYDELHKTI